MTPVVKDKKNKKLDDISNYRPFTIISALSKLFKACIYRKIKDKLSKCGLQLGYVSEGGCEKNLHVLSTVVNHFLKERTDVYMVTFDASAAFDKVNTYGFLSKLLDKGVLFDVVRTLLNWFGKNYACVRLNDCYSDYIEINNGIKQGGLISPIFYNVYIDELMKILMKAELGCTLRGRSYCALFYADDIILLSGSVSEMQKMLNICNEYGKKYGINFNERKTKWFCTDIYGKSRL